MKKQEVKIINQALITVKIDNLYYLCKLEEESIYNSKNIVPYVPLSCDKSYEKCLEKGLNNIFCYAERMEKIIQTACESWTGEKYSSAEMELEYINQTCDGLFLDGILYDKEKKEFYMIKEEND